MKNKKLEFKQFLVNNGAYDEFVFELERADMGNFNDYLDLFISDEWILSAFFWDETKSDKLYWESLNNLWDKINDK